MGFAEAPEEAAVEAACCRGFALHKWRELVVIADQAERARKAQRSQHRRQCHLNRGAQKALLKHMIQAVSHRVVASGLRI